jgi:hypothetical protein
MQRAGNVAPPSVLRITPAGDNFGEIMSYYSKPAHYVHTVMTRRGAPA